MSSARPVVPEKTVAEKLAESNAGFAYFLGTWDVIASTPGKNDGAHVSYEVRPLVGSAWLTGHAKSKELGIDSSDVWGRDPVSNEITRHVFDASGTIALVKSAGWAGGKLVLDGDARSRGGVVRIRETITSSGKNEFTAVWEAYRNGSWSEYSIEHVNRRKT